LNFIPKMPTAGALQEMLCTRAEPAVIVDAGAGALLGANAAGLGLWGLDGDLVPAVALDRAMPALACLRQIADAEPNAQHETLAFWTPRGLLASPCSRRRLSPGFGDAIFLIAWDHAREDASGSAVSAPADPARPSLANALAEAGSLGLGQIARRIREKSLAQPGPAPMARPAALTAASGAEGNVLANLAHELRTPLAAVIALAEIMTEEHLGPLPNERYRGYLRDIRDSARHGLALVDSLAAGDGTASSEIELVHSEVDLNEAARFCIATMQPLASKAGMVLDTAFAKELPWVVADTRCVRQILLNLLSNSVKYAGAGAHVTVRTGHELARQAWIEVADTGPGIAPEIAASTLEQVARPAAAGQQASTGLGLPLSRRLARANGARLQIESGASGGTVVRIAFTSERMVPV
jgi:signal transduction histidine kinase